MGQAKGGGVSPRRIGTVPRVGGWVYYRPRSKFFRVTEVRAQDRARLHISGGSDFHVVSEDGREHTGFQWTDDFYPCEPPQSEYPNPRGADW